MHTTENILALSWPILAAGLPPGVTLVRLRLPENPELAAEYFGGNP